MTNLEFSLEFDILYNSISSMDAPNLDEYEKSVFLTKAQLELIKEYNGPYNKYKNSFEGSDKRRADLRELIVNYTTTPVPTTTGVEVDSQEVELPSDLFLIKYEAAYYTKSGCSDRTKVDIVPIKYDEYHEKKRNPFRRPDKERGFRLDIQSLDGKKRAELITDQTLDSYQLRYIKYPNPIVLTDLGTVSSVPLSIDGVTDETECSLDTELHKEILDRAVQLAMVAYKQEGLQAKVQLDQRNN